MDETEQPAGDIPAEIVASYTRSLGSAYLFLPFLGHRFYLGDWFGGSLLLLLLIVSLGAGIFLVFYPSLLAVEAVLLPRVVRKRNAALANEMSMHPERFLILDEDHIAPWARGTDKRSSLGIRGEALRIAIFFVLLPGITGYSAAEFHSLELLIIPLVLLVAIGLISSLDRTLIRFPTILEVPGVGPALERVAGMRAHYWENEPKIILAYWGLFRHAFTRYKPYWGLASIVFATVVIEGFISWEDNTSYIPYGQAALIVGGTALIATAAMLFNLVPVTAVAFHYSLSGKTLRLRFMILAALFATILGYKVSKEDVLEDGTGQNPSYLSAQRLDARMQDPKFKRQLRERLELFLNYYVGSGNDPGNMRDNLSSLLQGIAPNDEPRAFGILETDNWMGVTRYHVSGDCFKNPYDYSIQGSETLPLKIVNEEGEVEAQYPKQFSLLALVYKLPAAAKRDEFVRRRNEGVDIVDIMKDLENEITFYSWWQMPEWAQQFFSYQIPEACQRLLCEKESSCATDPGPHLIVRGVQQ